MDLFAESASMLVHGEVQPMEHLSSSVDDIVLPSIISGFSSRPARSLSEEEPINFFCLQASGGSDAFGHTHYCANSQIQPIVVDETVPAMTLWNSCFTNNITNANREECGSLCFLVDASGNFCQTCAWTESNQVVYDCSNLFPAITTNASSCPARDTNQVCQPYAHWFCTASAGTGYYCRVRNGARNPALIHDPILVTEIETSLYSANDISGLTVASCQEPLCSILTDPELTLDNAERCSSCLCSSCIVEQVVPGGLENGSAQEFVPISYDCADAFPDLACPLLLPNGTCLNETLNPVTGPDNTTLWNVPSFLIPPLQSAFEGDDDDGGTGWTLKGIHPTSFNVLMDVFDKIVMLFVGMAIATLFPVFMSLQVKGGRKVPADQLGHVPSDFWTALNGFRAWQCSLVGLALVTMVVVADFSHSIADAGLNFVTVDMEAENGTVLVLGSQPERRNPQPPYEVYGDPAKSRTVVTNRNILLGNFEASRPETALVSSYLEAVTSIARGASAFTRENRTRWRRVTKMPYINVTVTDSNATFSSPEPFPFVWYYVDDGSALVSMDQEIPLECYAATEMANIERTLKGALPFDSPINMMTSVPNCALTDERPTGIFGGPTSTPQIVETMATTIVIHLTEEANIRLSNGNESFVSFEVTPASKQYARDRTDWKKGREFYDVDGLQIGNLTIPFASVYIGSGILRQDQSEYSLFASVDGDCPPRPSGISQGDEQCLVQINLLCDLFPEDAAEHYHPIYAPQLESSTCHFTRLGITWGRHFVLDQELVSIVAGIHGMVRPSLAEGTLRTFTQNGLLAALFALGVVEERPSVKQEVRPRINVTFVVFMSLPLAFSILLLSLAYWAGKKQSAPVATDSWQFLIMGAEQADLLPKRENKAQPFPPSDDSVVYAATFYDARETEVEEGVASDENSKIIVYELVKEGNSDASPPPSTHVPDSPLASGRDEASPPSPTPVPDSPLLASDRDEASGTLPP